MPRFVNLRTPVESGPWPINPGKAPEARPEEPPGQIHVSEEEWLALVHPEDLSRLDTGMRDMRRPDGPFASKFAIHQSDGSERWIFMWAEVFPGRGRLIHVAGARFQVTSAQQN